MRKFVNPVITKEASYFSMEQKKMKEEFNKSLKVKHTENILHKKIVIELYLKHKHIKNEYESQVKNLIFCINIKKRTIMYQVSRGKV